jgi:hypothetical protein
LQKIEWVWVSAAVRALRERFCYEEIFRGLLREVNPRSLSASRLKEVIGLTDTRVGGFRPQLTKMRNPCPLTGTFSK